MGKLLFLAFWILILIVANPLKGADLLVSSVADSGPGTLRQAILDAAEGDRITFSSGTDGRMIVLQSPITIDKSLDIVGNGSHLTIVSGGNATQVLSVSYVANLLIENISIVDGYHSGSGAAGLAIQSSNISLRFVTIEGNHGITAQGGGISLNGKCNFSAYGVVIKHNIARAGAGVYVYGFSDTETIVTFNQCEVSNNYSFAVSSSEGGGLRGYQCKLVLKNSKVVSNSVPHNDGSGGGVWTKSSTVVLSNTIISGNTAGNVNNAIRLNGPLVMLPN